MKDLEKKLVEMEDRIMNFQKENGFSTTFDFLNEDIEDIRQLVKSLLPVVIEKNEQFSFSDMEESFKAGDKFRLYLDKNAIGLGNTHDKDIPTSDKVLETMCFEKWIKNKK